MRITGISSLIARVFDPFTLLQPAALFAAVLFFAQCIWPRRPLGLMVQKESL